MKRVIEIKDVLIIALLIVAIVMSCTKTKDVIVSGPCNTNIPPGQTDTTITLSNQNHYMDTATARAYMERFLANRDSICNNSLPGQSNVIHASATFNRRAIQNLLLQDSCVGIEISYGLNEQKQLVPVISAISTHGARMYTPNDPCEREPWYLPHCFAEHPALSAN